MTEAQVRRLTKSMRHSHPLMKWSGIYAGPPEDQSDQDKLTALSTSAGFKISNIRAGLELVRRCIRVTLVM